MKEVCICGVSVPMFSERRHILAGLQCAEFFQINMQLSITDAYRARDRKLHIMAIMAGPVAAGDEKLI